MKAEKLESKKGNFYEVEIGSKSEEMKLVFDNEGNFIEQEMEDDDDRNDDDQKLKFHKKKTRSSGRVFLWSKVPLNLYFRIG